MGLLGVTRCRCYSLAGDRVSGLGFRVWVLELTN